MQDHTAFARKGRGAVTNAAGRFEPHSRTLEDDGWQNLEELSLEPLRTSVTFEKPKRAITRNTSPDVPFDQSINPYRGCEHGCIYCFARPTHAYHGLSPGLDFETKLFAKPDIANLLRSELSSPKYRVQPIAIGTNMDAYQPIERQLELMRAILLVCEEFGQPLSILTKSATILRDKDILARMAARNLVRTGLSVTTLDRRVARLMDPRASTPAKRLQAVKELSDAGVPVRVMVGPIVPGLTDHELEDILMETKIAGACGAGYTLLRLPREVRDLFVEWLGHHFPDRARKVMKLVRETHGGKDYDPAWGKRMRGSGVYAELIRQRFHRATVRLELTGDTQPLSRSEFRQTIRPDGQMLLNF